MKLRSKLYLNLIWSYIYIRWIFTVICELTNFSPKSTKEFVIYFSIIIWNPNLLVNCPYNLSKMAYCNFVVIYFCDFLIEDQIKSSLPLLFRYWYRIYYDIELLWHCANESYFCNDIIVGKFCLFLRPNSLVRLLIKFN